MKIIHFSDTHLWIWMDNTSRDEDFYKNFIKIIEDIVKEKPDFVIHSGDLFNSSKPSNKAISVTIKWFLKLEKAGIKVIIIAWNHDTPRLSTTTHSFTIFENFEHFKVIYKEELEIFETEKINFVCLPHIYSEEKFKQQFNEGLEFLNEEKSNKELKNSAKKNNKINIFISHFGLQAQEYEEYTDEISGVNILISELEKLKKFDYVALWHYHKNFCISKKICYSGSLEHTSFNAKDHKIGYNILEFDEDWNFEKKVKYLQTRKMIDLWIIDCEKIENTDELLEKIISMEEYSTKEEFKNYLSGAIVKIFFENINNNLLLEFQDIKITDFFSETFHFEYRKAKLEDKKNNFDAKIDISNSNFVEDIFSDFLKDFEIPEWINREELEKELIEKIKS